VDVLVWSDPQAAVRHVYDEIGDEGDAALPREQERVLRRAGAWSEDCAQAAGQLVTVAVAHVGLLLDLPRQGGCIHRRAELAPVAPGGALVRAGRQADRGHVAEAGERLGSERKRIDQDDALIARHGVGRADEVDPIVVHAPRPHAGDDLVHAFGDCLRLAHGRIS
jgi:hypothetical protein